MAHALLTHSYHLRLDPKQWRLGQPYAPLGTLYAAATLRDEGHTVALHDAMFARGAQDMEPVLHRERPDWVIIYDDGFNYLTKMCLLAMREAAFEMCRLARAYGCRVAVSSSDATDHYQEYLHAGAHVVIMGEGEETLRILLEGKTEWEAVAGIAYLHHREAVTTPKRPVMRQLDDLPMPAWDLVDIKRYRRMWLNSTGYFSINVATTRGCPFKCNWCAKPIYGNRYNSRSPEHVVAELRYLVRNFGAEHVWFCDDIFGLKPEWVARFAQLVQEEKLKFRFKIQSRADLLLKGDTVEQLAAAGCETVWMGAESGSQRILDAMDKGITVSQIQQACAQLKNFGIKPAFFLQFGYLGETSDDIDATLNLLLEAMPHDIGISVSYPLPGTPFYEKVKADLGQKANWKDSDELALMFRNTHRPQFYKRLHRFIHKRFRLAQAFEALQQLREHPLAFSPEHLRRALSAVYYLPAAGIEARRLRQERH